MDQFNSNATPDDPDRLPPARRRRARRLLAPVEADERAAFLDIVARRASPSFDFFLFSLLAGAVIAGGFLLNAPAILVLGALISPLMTPVVGVALGTVIGSGRFFFHSLVGLLVGSLLVFMVGWLAGYAVRIWLPLPLTLAHYNAQLSWPNFLVLALGAGLTAAAMARSEQSAVLPSVALAYCLYLPLSAAGIGLGSGEPFLWPDGLVVYALHLAWAALFGAFTLAIIGFRPLTVFGYTLGGVIVLIGMILLIGISGAGVVIGTQVALPTPVPTSTATATLTVTPSLTPLPPTTTSTMTLTPTFTPTTTKTPVPTATPVLALVVAGEAGGAFIRTEPGFQSPSVALLANGTLVQILPDNSVEEGGRFWVHIRTMDSKEGWILVTLLATATPSPNW